LGQYIGSIFKDILTLHDGTNLMSWDGLTYAMQQPTKVKISTASRQKPEILQFSNNLTIKSILDIDGEQ
jgi:hypothetical protein